MSYIKRLIRDLSWDNTKKVQERAIRELRNINDEDIVLLANHHNSICSKDCWENSAIVLKELGYPRIYPVIPHLMKWFQDVNWPGVLTLLELFKESDVLALIPYIEEALKVALKEDDEMWIEGLNHLARELKITL